MIYPELTGKLDGLAVRVPLLNASLTDAVFSVARDVDVDEVNGLLRAAADGSPRRDPRLRGAAARVGRLRRRHSLGHRRRACPPMVIDGRMVKVLAWYDNEFGYAFRMADLAARRRRDSSSRS